jgi:glucarate dehydratase
VKVILSDHHYWGGLRATQQLAHMCRLWDLGMSMHSNSHLGISLMAMTHVAAAIPTSPTPATRTTRGRTRRSSRAAAFHFRGRCRGARAERRPGLGVQIDREALAKGCTTSTWPAASAIRDDQ